MSLVSLIDRVEEYCPGWSRSTGNRSILKLVQMGLDELYNYDGENRMFIDPDNMGFPPYLETQSNVVRYNVTAANLSVDALTVSLAGADWTVRCKYPKRVFIDTTQGLTDYDRRWIGVPYAYSFQSPYSTSKSRITVANYPTRSQAATEDTEAWVEFIEDPGSSTDKYFLEFVYEAPRLTSEYIPIPFPVEYERALEDFVIGYVQRRSSGRANDNEVKFDEYWKPRFIKSFTDMVTNLNNNETYPRVC